jgi:hypothetical protein
VDSGQLGRQLLSGETGPIRGWPTAVRRLRRKRFDLVHQRNRPGFSGDSLVYTALSLAAGATAITVQENVDYGSYDDAGFTGASFRLRNFTEPHAVMFVPDLLAAVGAPRRQLPGSRQQSLSTLVATRVQPLRCF